MISVSAEAGSFRDPAGRVYEAGDRVFRTVAARAVDDYEFLRETGLLRWLTHEKWLIDAEEVDPKVLGDLGKDAAYVIEHPRLPFISYPYEWSFPMLKAGALLHLDLHIQALQHDVTLSDASAYNIQFYGSRPIFIDLLSLRRYREGEFWLGHRQFCEQFLNPLLLTSFLGVSHTRWYRGNLEGIPVEDMNRLLPLRRKLSWRVMTHIVLQARLQRTAIKRQDKLKSIKKQKLPRATFLGMLAQLRKWIAGLEPAGKDKSLWGEYSDGGHGYAPQEQAAKHKFVAEFCEKVKPPLLWDLGCNTGEYSECALEAGAQYVVGFDFDQHALEAAFARSHKKDLDFLPLFLDAANPSPSQGWNESERKGLKNRAKANAILALAFEHHLAVGRNIPLDSVVSWLVNLAPKGIIEFVPKSDPRIQQMLTLREDIFTEYDQKTFTTLLERNARIVRAESVSATGRHLFWYDRT